MAKDSGPKATSLTLMELLAEAVKKEKTLPKEVSVVAKRVAKRTAAEDARKSATQTMIRKPVSSDDDIKPDALEM